MKQETSDVLRALNLSFYERHADAFSRTREQAWRGCQRALDHVAATAPSVLDVGCGNGRLRRLLAQRYAGAFTYTGVDASARLLSLAAQASGASTSRLVYADFIAADPERVLPEDRYDAVALLGVMHHVPRESMRRRLVEAAAARVVEGGVLTLTVWHFDRDERLMRRTVHENDRAQLPAELRDAHRDLERGDHLLYWGPSRETLRYCHAADDAEITRWLHGLDLVTIDRFCADGSGERMNEYVVLQRRRAALAR